MLKAILFPFTVLALVVGCFSAGAAAESLVPPGNSAASQYTETFPTSKGEEDEQGKKKSGVTPAQVLGAGKAHQLEGKGPTGKKVAEFAAETSPTTVPAAVGGEEAAAGDGKSQAPEHGSKRGGSNGDSEQSSEGSGGAAGRPSGGGSGGSGGAGAQASGSSGLGEVVSQATGTSSGSLGLLLPLILIAVVIWSVAYVWRNRQQRVV